MYVPSIRVFSLVVATMGCAGFFVAHASAANQGTGTCGDGIIQKPNSHGVMEECDDGPSNRTDGPCYPMSCKKTPGLGHCGDGIIQKPNANGTVEECDDGPNNSTDGPCYPISCKKTPGLGHCGDGIIQKPNAAGLTEACDDGELNGTPQSTCAKTCQPAQDVVPLTHSSLAPAPAEEPSLPIPAPSTRRHNAPPVPSELPASAPVVPALSTSHPAASRPLAQSGPEMFVMAAAGCSALVVLLKSRRSR